MNVGTLDRMAGKHSGKKEEGKQFIDLDSLGYTKLLGAGKITKRFTVKVALCSAMAAEKVRKAGGEVLMEAQEAGK
jgi:large subunit ribosomal protein L15